MELLGICLVFGAIYMYERISNKRTMDKLLDRLMAKSLPEYAYYDKQHPTDIKSLKKLRQATTREWDVQDSPAISDPDVANFMNGLEEDWGAGEIDIDRIKEQIGAENS